MALEDIREFVANRLPANLASMQLSFYGHDSEPDGDHVIVGDDSGCNLCVYPTDGTVWSIDPHGEYRKRFANSSLDQFAQCVCAADVAVHARGLREEIERTDPTALSHPENWWSVWLEDAEVYGC